MEIWWSIVVKDGEDPIVAYGKYADEDDEEDAGGEDDVGGEAKSVEDEIEDGAEKTGGGVNFGPEYEGDAVYEDVAQYTAKYGADGPHHDGDDGREADGQCFFQAEYGEETDPDGIK